MDEATDCKRCVKIVTALCSETKYQSAPGDVQSETVLVNAGELCQTTGLPRHSAPKNAKYKAQKDMGILFWECSSNNCNINLSYLLIFSSIKRNT